MDIFYQEYFNRLTGLHKDVSKALEGLPQEALDFKPAEDIPSICILVVHLTGAERYWIGDVAASDPSDRDRDREFQSRGLSESALKERLESIAEYVQIQLGSMTIQDLTASRVSPRDRKKFSVAWALLHALEHTAIHLGHVQIIRQLWERSQSLGEK